MSDLYSILDWQPVLLVKATREPFTVTQSGLSVKHAYLALHPDGVVYSAWDIPENERICPRVLLVGWNCICCRLVRSILTFVESSCPTA